MNTSINIRNVTPQDAAELNHLVFQSSIGMYQMHGYDLPEIEAKFADRNSVAGLEHTVNMINSLTVNEKYIVATIEDKIVGLCYAEKGIDRNTLWALYLLPDFQKQGIGKMLWENIRVWLGKGDVYLNVLNLNGKAIQFYEKLGFKETGVASVKPGLTTNSQLKEIEMVLKDA